MKKKVLCNWKIVNGSYLTEEILEDDRYDPSSVAFAKGHYLRTSNIVSITSEENGTLVVKTLNSEYLLVGKGEKESV